MASSMPVDFDPTLTPSISPPPGVKSNFINPICLGETILVISITTSVLAAIFLSMRLYSTLAITHSASYEDSTAILAFLMSVATVGLVNSTGGIARHGWDLPISSYTAQFFMIQLSGIFTISLGYLFSKVSVLLLLFRIFSRDKAFRYHVYITLVWTTTISIVSMVVGGILCTPRQGERFDSLAVVTRSTHQAPWAVIQGVLNACLDFYILYLPIQVVMKLQMKPRKKIGVMAIFLTGFSACVASVTSLAFKIKLLTSDDKLWETGKLDILNVVELNTTIMVAGMPACASFFKHFFSDSRVVSAIKSRILVYLNSKSRSPNVTELLSELPAGSTAWYQVSQHSPRTTYCRIRDAISKSVIPPRILSGKQLPRFKGGGHYEVFDDRPELHKSPIAKQSTSPYELKADFSEKRIPSATAAYHTV